MAGVNRVVWSEGLFLRPEHFQQQDRFVERYVELRSAALRPYPWGVSELEIDQNLLGVGKFAVISARGVFPDGTPFSIPDDDPVPRPIDVTSDTRDQVVSLAIPLRAPRRTEFNLVHADEPLARFEVRDFEAADCASHKEEAAALQVGAVRTRLIVATQPREDFACIPIAHIVEKRADNRVVLDAGFIPSALSLRAATQLDAFVTELLGMLRQRGDALGGRVSGAGRGGAAEIADFMLLQMVNRLEPQIAHLVSHRAVHPELLFETCAAMAGELATFTSPTRRTGVFPLYRHENPREAFEPVIRAIRTALGTVIETLAVPIPLELRGKAVRIGVLADRSLLDGSAFVLAVRADVSGEELRRHLPAQIKIGPVEKIKELVQLALPGIGIAPLPVAPRQLPYHAGSVYFELDRATPLWAAMRNSGGFAMHVGIDYPGLELEFWAIRSGK